MFPYKLQIGSQLNNQNMQEQVLFSAQSLSELADDAENLEKVNPFDKQHFFVWRCEETELPNLENRTSARGTLGTARTEFDFGLMCHFWKRFLLALCLTAAVSEVTATKE